MDLTLSRPTLRVGLFSLMLGAFFFFVTSVTEAFAATVSAPAAPVVFSQITPQTLAGLIGAGIPILVSLLARSEASSAVKIWINLVLTAATGAVTALVVVNPDTGVSSFGWVPFLTAWLFAFISSSVSYLSVLSKIDLNDLLLGLGGLFGQGSTGAGVAGAVAVLADGTKVDVQDEEALVNDEFPPVDDDDLSVLDAPVDGVDR